MKSVKISANETISISAMMSGFGSGIGVLPLIMVLQTIAVSKAFGRINRCKIDTFLEILAVGLGNVFGSLFKALPMTPGFGRSAVCSSSGSKTPVAGLISNISSSFICLNFRSFIYSFAPLTFSKLISVFITSVSFPFPVAALGTEGPGAEIICGTLFENFLSTKIILQVFSLKFFCHKGVFKCFPVISFQFFLKCGAPSALPKVRGLGSWPPWPP